MHTRFSSRIRNIRWHGRTRVQALRVMCIAEEHQASYLVASQLSPLALLRWRNSNPQAAAAMAVEDPGASADTGAGTAEGVSPATGAEKGVGMTSAAGGAKGGERGTQCHSQRIP